MDFFNSFNKKNGTLVHDVEKCVYCGRCAEKCPHIALKVDRGARSWRLKLICMKCGRCVKECPQGALVLKKQQ